MRQRQKFSAELAGNPILTGAVLLLAALIGVVVSYNANKGLPFVPTYQVDARVPDAAELIRGGSEVRAGGARVGIVKEVEPELGEGTAPPYARLRLALDKNLEGIPVDSTVQVRPRSILGAKYVDLVIGKSTREVPAGGTLPLKQAIPVVELDEAFNTFDAETSEGIRNSISELGNALAGRGESLNQAVGAAGRLMPPLQRVLRNITSDRADLSGFIRGTAAATGALAPVATTLGSLFDHGATTMQAIDAAGPALGEAIEELPQMEAVGTRALSRIGPVLADAAVIARAIRPGTRVLPRISRNLAGALDETTPVLRRTPAFAARLDRTLAALNELSTDAGFFQGLVQTTSNLLHLGSVMDLMGNAQIQCNFIGLFARNASSIISRGDRDGSWFNILLVVQRDEMLQSSHLAPNLHSNYFPNMNRQECENGNEPYSPGQKLGNPDGLQSNKTQNTAPPPGVRELAEKAGLVGPMGGSR
jgi:virulence factor Mce-like protein